MAVIKAHDMAPVAWEAIVASALRGEISIDPACQQHCKISP